MGQVGGFNAKIRVTYEERKRWQVTSYLQSTVLVTSDLVIAVTVTIEGRKHDAERAGPLTEKDEEMMSQRLLGEEKTPVVD